jgi:undecaprenyl pyrophosphate phosphatase UppP
MLILLFTMAILLALRDRYYPRLPAWLFGVGVVVAAVAHPVLWNLSYPDIYVAAIAWGQALLLGGLFVALPAILGAEIDWRRLALAAALWCLAIGSRYTLAPAVLVCAGATVVGVLKLRLPRGQWFRMGIAVGLPTALVMTALAAYNLARFGSAAETGLQYQMTPRWDYTALARAGEIFNVRYVVPNVIYYGILPFKTRPEFPFLAAQRGELMSVRAFLRGAQIPNAYSVEDINGFLLAVPFSVFALVWVVRLSGVAQPAEQNATTTGAQALAERGGLARVSLAMLIAAAITGLLILAYRHVANRFAMDFSPLLVIPAVLGAWELRVCTKGRPILGPLAVILILALAIAAVAASVLLGVGGPASRIDDYNPALWALLKGLGR